MPSFDLRCTQKDVLLIPFRVEVSAGDPSLVDGNSFLTLVDGGVGLYEFTFGGSYGQPSARLPIVTVTALATGANEFIANISALATTGFTVAINDDAGTAADISIMGTVVWFGTSQQQ